MAIMRTQGLIPAVTGKLGNIVLVTNKDGVATVRERVIPANPRTPSQMKARNDMSATSRLWGELSDEERQAWEAFAETQGRSGYHTFVGLATKWRRINGNGMPPSSPPTEAFFGDSVGLSMAPGAAGTETIVLTAQRPNQPELMVELLVQRLAATHIKPTPRNWKTGAYVAFVAGSLTHSLILFPGAYALGYRYVNAATGQETAMALLGKLIVS